MGLVSSFRDRAGILSGLGSIALAASSLAPVGVYANVFSQNAAEITRQPVSVRVCEGTTATFTVGATPTSAGKTLVYRWTIGGEDAANFANQGVSGFDTPTLTINPASVGLQGQVAVVIDVFPADPQFTPVTSVAVDLVVDDALFLTEGLTPQSACEGTPVVLRAAVDQGTPGVTWTWYKDNVLIPGAVSGTYTTASTGFGGTYKVVASGTCGSDSSTAEVTARTAPRITQEPPQLIEVDPGGNLSITVGVSGSEVLEYTWSHNGVPVPGQNQATFQKSNITSNDWGTYTVTVRNGCGNAAISREVLVKWTSSVADDAVQNGFRLSTTEPSPVSDAARLNVTVPSAQNVRIVLNDVTGRQVAVLFEGMLEGTRAVSFNAAALNLPAGVYFAQMNAAGFNGTVPVTVVR